MDEWNGPKNHWRFPSEINHLNKKQKDSIGPWLLKSLDSQNGSINAKYSRICCPFGPCISEKWAKKSWRNIWEFRGWHFGHRYTRSSGISPYLISTSTWHKILVSYVQEFLMFRFHLFSPPNPYMGVPFQIAEVWHRRHRGATWLRPKGQTGRWMSWTGHRCWENCPLTMRKYTDDPQLLKKVSPQLIYFVTMNMKQDIDFGVARINVGICFTEGMHGTRPCSGRGVQFQRGSIDRTRVYNYHVEVRLVGPLAKINPASIDGITKRVEKLWKTVLLLSGYILYI